MKRVLLVDSDSKIINIALAKLSAFYKGLGYKVDLMRLNYRGYIRRGSEPITINASKYDKVFVSTIFTHNKDMVKIINCNEVEFGGTGNDCSIKLKPEVDICPMDEGIYAKSFLKEVQNREYKTEEKKQKAISKVMEQIRTAYGFITRGCIRNCSFCLVRGNEGYIYRYRQIDEIFNPKKHDRAYFMDNNILAHPDCIEIFKEIIAKGIRCQFNQGLDIRLLTEESALLLKKMKWFGEYIFAFDSIGIQPIIESKLQMLKDIGFDKPLKFYVFMSPKHTCLKDDIYRVEWLREKGILPYPMRENTCWNSSYSDVYTDVTAWSTQPDQFKKRSFDVWMKERHPNDPKRIAFVLGVFNRYARNVPWQPKAWYK